MLMVCFTFQFRQVLQSMIAMMPSILWQKSSAPARNCLITRTAVQGGRNGISLALFRGCSAREDYGGQLLFQILKEAEVNIMSVLQSGWVIECDQLHDEFGSDTLILAQKLMCLFVVFCKQYDYILKRLIFFTFLRLTPKKIKIINMLIKNVCCSYLLSCLYLLAVQAHCRGHNLSCLGRSWFSRFC